MVPPASHGVSRVPWYSGFRPALSVFAYGTFTLFGLGFPSAHSANCLCHLTGPQPHFAFLLSGLGSSAFARHYLRNHYCFLFLRVLGCFGSPRLPPHGYVFTIRYPNFYFGWVPPFGHLRVDGYLRLTVAFRSLSRPSSAPGAKAFTLRSL